MGLRVVRLGAAVALILSGAVLVAASWQRWAGVCGWGELGSRACLERQDHLYDVVPTTAPWEPVGASAELAGASMLLLAVGLALLPWALTGRRPGAVTAVALAGAVLASTAVGVATLLSGLAGEVVDPAGGGATLRVWLFVTPVLLVHLALTARGWGRAAAALLVLAAPLVALFSYALGPYDARPWWEAVSGVLVMAAGACLVGRVVTGARAGALRSGLSRSRSGAGRAGAPTRPAP